jgi:vacuolar protein-sorting-associated protein 4
MAYVDFTSKAVEIFKKGAAHDEKKEYEEAYKWYLESVDVFMTAIKYEKKNPTKRDMLRAKVAEIIERAEKIKEHIDSAKSSPPAPGPGTEQEKVKGKGKSKEDEDDKDKNKMRSNLEGAIVKLKPNVKWSDIAGLEGAKEALREAVILPIKFPQFFTGNRKPWRAILMYGPPGTGKSYLAKAVATESDSTFFSVSSADLMSKWVGDSEKQVRSLFELAREASRENGKASIIFVDEIDSMCSARGENDSDATKRMKTEFLVQMQGVSNDDTDVLVLAATNIPWGLDSAIRRRFERRIFIPLPDAQARCQMFKIHLGQTPNTLTDEDFRDLAEVMEMYSGSDINVLVRNAMMECIRTLQIATHFKYITGPNPHEPNTMCSDLLLPCGPSEPGAFEMSLFEAPDPKKVVPPAVCKMDFLKAMRTARPSVCEADIEQHTAFTRDFGQEG